VASTILLPLQTRQDLLETIDTTERLQKISLLLGKAYQLKEKISG
jgi:hypothetical protein